MRTGNMQNYDNDGNECLDDMNPLIGQTIRAIECEFREYEAANGMKVPVHTIIIVCDNCAFETSHSQDCCETVEVHDIIGDLNSLIGKKVINCKTIESQEWPSDVEKGQYVDSFTWTTQIIQTKSTEIKIRWLGESNGWYSEGIYFRRIAVPLKYLGE